MLVKHLQVTEDTIMYLELREVAPGSSKFCRKKSLDFSYIGKQMMGCIRPIKDAVRPQYSASKPSFLYIMCIALNMFPGYFALQFFSLLLRKISACMRVRVSHSGFVIKLPMAPAIPADKLYNLKSPSSHPFCLLNSYFIFSYMGKQRDYWSGNVNADTKYPR